MDMEQNKKCESNEYSKAYSESSLFNKIMKTAKKAGIKVIYAALLLFYTLQKPLTPAWAKGTIVGALGYFILPIDVIPDLVPVLGFTDDLGALAVAITAVAMFIDDEVKQKSKAKLKDWFGKYDESTLEDIDNKVNDK